MTPKEVLIRGKERLERGWCRETSARDASGNHSYPESPDAVSFCVFGAMHEREDPYASDRARELIRRVLGAKLGDGAIASYNDTPGRTKEEILTLVGKAINLAEG